MYQRWIFTIGLLNLSSKQVQTLHLLILPIKSLLISNSLSPFCWVNDYLYFSLLQCAFPYPSISVQMTSLSVNAFISILWQNSYSFSLHIFIYKYMLEKVRTSLSHIYIMWRKYRRWIENYSSIPKYRQEVQLISLKHTLYTKKLSHFIFWKILWVGFFFFCLCFYGKKEFEGNYGKIWGYSISLRQGEVCLFEGLLVSPPDYTVAVIKIVME